MKDLKRRGTMGVTGELHSVEQVVFSPGGKLVAIGSSDKITSRRGVFRPRALTLAVTAFTTVQWTAK